MRNLLDKGGILLRTSSSQAAVAPGMGANCIALSIGDADVLRTPESYAVLEKSPNVYGMPLLFPPNRIRGGVFVYSGRRYGFPINEPLRGNHLHGVLSSTAFDIEYRAGDADSDAVELVYRATDDKPYMSFPHAFTVRRLWKLTQDALYQRLAVRNDSGEAMPIGIGFHTALNVCFDTRDLRAEHYRLKMSAAEEIINDPKTIIPTGERRTDSAILAKLNGGGIAPQGTPISCHMVRGSGGAELVHTPSGRYVSFTVSDTLGYWMLWNGDGQSGFICPEPQSWMIDAPNQSQDTAMSGFRVIAPGECFTAETCIRLVENA